MQDQQPSIASASIPNAVKANKKTQSNSQAAEQVTMKEAAPQVLAAI